MMNEPEIFSIVGLEDSLREDQQGIKKLEVINKLEECSRTVKQSMDKGVSPDQFAILKTQHQGIEAAINVVEVVWKQYNSI